MEWYTGVAEDEVGHSGAKQLFSCLLVWSIFHNGIQVKDSREETRLGERDSNALTVFL